MDRRLGLKAAKTQQVQEKLGEAKTRIDAPWDK
jgi:hypothetical protein